MNYRYWANASVIKLHSVYNNVISLMNVHVNMVHFHKHNKSKRCDLSFLLEYCLKTPMHRKHVRIRYPYWQCKCSQCEKEVGKRILIESRIEMPYVNEHLLHFHSYVLDCLADTGQLLVCSENHGSGRLFLTQKKTILKMKIFWKWSNKNQTSAGRIWKLF